jgi:pimeloyl-ACP methyl ester carboxylesterase
MTTPINRRTMMKRGAMLTSALSGVALSPEAGAQPAQTATRPAAAPPTTYVVAHGAWSSGWAWKKMHPLMQARGHRLFTPSYTGLGERAHLASPNVDLDTHITDVVNALVFEDLRDVVLIAHSYGGVVGTGVADRARDRIRRLIYLDAFVPEDGKSFFELTGQGDQIRKAAVDGWRVPPNPPPPDTSPEDVQWMATRRLHHPIKTFEQRFTLTKGPLTMPRDYILCTKSPAFDSYAAKATAAGWGVHRLDASHNPHITIPDQLMNLLDRIVQGSRA